MTKEFAEETVTKYLKPIYAFALKRCACIEDAQDLTQDIALCVYRSLVREGRYFFSRQVYMDRST